MDRIGVVGISWREGGPEALARFTLPLEGRAEKIHELARSIQVEEVFYLATCNRVEIAFVGDGETPLADYRPAIFSFFSGRPAEPGEAEKTFKAWGGEGAAEHLALVASGLASAKVGENEIAGQFRDAFKFSRQLGLCGIRLEIVLEESLKVAAQVRGLAGFGDGRVSLAEIALDRIRDHLSRHPGTIAMVGVSPMTERCALSLAAEKAPIVVVNRSLERARELAKKVGGSVCALADFQDDPQPVEALITATGAPGAILSRASLERMAARSVSGQGPILVDMAVPPDIDPNDASQTGLTRYGMEEILVEAEATRGKRVLEVAEARTLVDQSLITLRRRLAECMLGPVLANVQRHYQDTGLMGLERLFNKELTNLDEAEKQIVKKWMNTLARRFAHFPTKGLKQLAVESGSTSVESFLRDSQIRENKEKPD